MVLTPTIFFFHFLGFSCGKDRNVKCVFQDSLKANNSKEILVGNIDEVWNSLGCEVEAYYSFQNGAYEPKIVNEFLYIGTLLEGGVIESVIWDGKVSRGDSSTIFLKVNYCYDCADCSYHSTVKYTYRKFNLKPIKDEFLKVGIPPSKIELEFYQKNKKYTLLWE